MRLVVPSQKLGLFQVTTDPEVNGDTERIATALAGLLGDPATSSVAVSYQDTRYPEFTVRLSGVSGRVENPGRVLDVVFTQIHRADGVAPVAAGQWGGFARCGWDRYTQAHVCAWADHSSIGSVTLTGYGEAHDPVKDFLFLRGRAERPA
ncbi:hypothetical protein [Micromonospora coxensis]|uniref:hypothetical protein n=1 Tax=Micromonospora coxensis TaxID=356852 RepID=UPI0034435132